MDVLRAPSPMLFDPISLLVDEATAEVVGEEPQELLYDFLDCLMLQQQQPPPLVMPGGASPIEPQGDRQNSPSGTRKRRSTSRFIEDDDDEPVLHVGSPVSTMHLSAGYDILPMNSKLHRTASYNSTSSSNSSSGHGSPHRERSHHGHSQGLSRKNRPQRCSICKECGHKSRTCKFAGAKMGLRPSSPDGFNITI